ncbi:MAG: glycosyltransferase [bacterium]
MRVALVHEFLVTWGGSDLVVQKFAEIYPDAPIYTALYDRGAMGSRFPGRVIKTSFLQRIPCAARRHRLLMPFFPLAFEGFDLSGYDLVLSSHHMAAKGVITAPRTCHVCFVHTPMRYAWDMYHDFVGRQRRVLRFPMRVLFHYLRGWDVATAGRVDYFIANSRNVANRIAKYYRRDAVVVHSPVEASRFFTGAGVDDYYLAAGRLVRYKRIDLAVEAFNRLGRRLVIAGAGPETGRLRGPAKGNVEFRGFVSDEELAGLYSRCRGFIFPGEEDFGITPLEAQASGRPVIAYRAGGALETVVEGETGVFFDEQTPESLMRAVEAADGVRFDPERIRAHALGFDVAVFKEKIGNFVEEKMKEWKGKTGI